MKAKLLVDNIGWEKLKSYSLVEMELYEDTPCKYWKLILLESTEKTLLRSCYIHIGNLPGKFSKSFSDVQGRKSNLKILVKISKKEPKNVKNHFCLLALIFFKSEMFFYNDTKTLQTQ